MSEQIQATAQSSKAKIDQVAHQAKKLLRESLKRLEEQLEGMIDTTLTVQRLAVDGAVEVDVRQEALDEREKALELRERQSQTENLQKELALRRARIEAGLEREAVLAKKLEETRKALGVANAQLTKINSAFPHLLQSPSPSSPLPEPVMVGGQ